MPRTEVHLRPLILLIEDDDAVRRAIHLLLSAHGYDVLAFPSGLNVAAQNEALRASCLVADLIIPSGDGISILQDLRAAGWMGPAILISGHLTDELATHALELGFDRVLPKPVGDTVLVNALARLLADHPGNSATQSSQ
jgi:FixJ family two-component response regulator